MFGRYIVIFIVVIGFSGVRGGYIDFFFRREFVSGVSKAVFVGWEEVM